MKVSKSLGTSGQFLIQEPKAPESFALTKSLKAILSEFQETDENSFKNCKVDSSGLSIVKSVPVQIKKLETDKEEITREDYRPLDEDLPLIALRALETPTKKSGYVIEVVAFDAKVDRAYEHFLPLPAPVFLDAVRLYSKKAWLRDHAWDTDHEVGWVLKAYIKGSGLDTQLILRLYVQDIPENQGFLNKLFGGTHSGVSVGFVSPYESYLCDSCNRKLIESGSTNYQNYVSIFDRERCGHKPGAYDSSGVKTTVGIYSMEDAIEISNTPTPCQREAGTVGKEKGKIKSMSTEVIQETLANDVVNDPSPEQVDESVAETSVKNDNSEPAARIISDSSSGDGILEVTNSEVSTNAKESDGVPVSDQAHAAPGNTGGVANTDQSPYDAHALKEAIEANTASNVKLAEQVASYMEAVNAHKAALDEHLNSFKTLVTPPADAVEVAELVPPTPTQEQIDAEAAKAAKAEADEKKVEVLMKMIERLIESNTRFLESQSPKETTQKTWAEKTYSRLPQKNS